MRSTVLVLVSVALAATITADAKVVRTTLEELVEKSELVLYGVRPVTIVANLSYGSKRMCC